MAQLQVGIIGASGYTGGELVRLLMNHPMVSIECVCSRTYDNRAIAEVFPNLSGFIDLKCENLEPDEVAARCDVVFAAVPHGVAMKIAPAVKNAGKKLIDLGPDFRFDSVETYQAWYHLPHDTPELLPEAVYGITELNRERIKGTWLVGNPGCYPTTVLLGVAPLLDAGLVETDRIVVDAKSGVSGAGRKPGLTYHYPECNENLRPYGVVGHRHTPEIEQELGKLAGKAVSVIFTPHLTPMTRGMLSTIYLSLITQVDEEELLALYRDFYDGNFFVRILDEGRLPETKAVYGSNFCDIAVRVEKRTNTAIVMAAIDNLVKGASGQAVQNMNLMCGFEERLGLDLVPVFP